MNLSKFRSSLSCLSLLSSSAISSSRVIPSNSWGLYNASNVPKGTFINCSSRDNSSGSSGIGARPSSGGATVSGSDGVTGTGVGVEELEELEVDVLGVEGAGESGAGGTGGAGLGLGWPRARSAKPPARSLGCPGGPSKFCACSGSSVIPSCASSTSSSLMG